MYLLYVLEKLVESDLFVLYFFVILCGCIVILKDLGVFKFYYMKIDSV